MKMKKKIFLLLVCILIAVLVAGMGAGMASAKTWHVCYYGNGGFSSIQDAIDAADPGDVIFVHDGTYYENLIVNKSLKLIGESRGSVIHGAWYDGCIKITSSNVSVEGFTIKYSAEDASGIIVMANNSTIANNTINENGYGICLYGNNTTIINNNVSDNGVSDVYLQGGFNVIANNFIGGILIHSNNNSIVNNTIKEGFQLKRATCHNEITDNIMEVGIKLKESNYNGVMNNTLDYISLSDSNCNKMVNNNVKIGIDLERSSYNKIVNNTAKYINIKYREVCWTIAPHLEKCIYPSEYSEYNEIANNTVGEGVSLEISDYNKIVNNTAKYISLEGASNNEIINNIINQSHANGISIGDKCLVYHSDTIGRRYCAKHFYSKYNEITNNNISSNQGIGIFLFKSNNTCLSNNSVRDNGYGIKLQSSSNITIANNDLSGNRYNFGVSGNELSHYIHSIDTSNKIEGKPIYYLVNERDRKVHGDAGYVGIVNSTNITVKDLKVEKNEQGVLLAYNSGKNQINNNTIKDNEHGIYLCSGSSFNRIYHNNFVNNTRNAEEYKSANYFDNGPIIGGNYWSNHKCKKNPSNGTQPYIIPVHNNTDKYPFEKQNGWL